MSISVDKNIGKIFRFHWLGDIRYFIFSDDGKKCWISYKNETGDYIIRKALTEDWMFIGDENSEGFIDCDFSGCDFSNFDITGTKFFNCTFDCGVFDYSFVSYEGMIDCKFISGSKSK